MFPDGEEHRDVGAAEDVVGDFEGRALAHAGANVDKRIGIAQQRQAVQAEILRCEGRAHRVLKMFPERGVGLRLRTADQAQAGKMAVDPLDFIDTFGNHAGLQFGRLRKGLADKNIQILFSGDFGHGVPLPHAVNDCRSGRNP